MKVCNHETTGYVRLIVRSALGENRDAMVPGEVVPHHREHLVIVDVREELAITRIAMAHNHVVVLAGLDGRGLALHVVDQNVLVAEDLLHDVVAIVQLRLTRPRHAYQNVSGNHRFRRELGSLALGLTRGEKPNENVAVLQCSRSFEEGGSKSPSRPRTGSRAAHRQASQACPSGCARGATR